MLLARDDIGKNGGARRGRRRPFTAEGRPKAQILIVVELRGIEPLTSCMPCTRSPS
jgi:hypothetical protein